MYVINISGLLYIHRETHRILHSYARNKEESFTWSFGNGMKNKLW